MTEAALSFDHVSYAYRSDMSRAKILALSDLTFDVQPGEAFAFLGHNGAGKTTTIKCLLDFVRPAGGKVSIFGKSSRDPASRSSVGYVPEQPYFYDYLSVGETLEFYARLLGVPRNFRCARIDDVLGRLGIKDRRAQRMRTLSKGLIQRVAMAQALLGEPKLLVLDEPFSGLDPIGRKHFRDMLLEEKRRGTTIFMATHILSDVERICDRASILATGQLKQVLSLKDLESYTTPTYELIVRGNLPELKEPALSYDCSAYRTRVVFSTQKAAESALEQALSARVEIDSFEVLRGDLEQIFVRLVEESKGVA